MDVLFINSFDFVPYSNPHIGQSILKNILRNHYSVECISFDYLNQSKDLVFKESMPENIIMFGEYILAKNPKVVGFYTICNSFFVTVQVAQYIKEKNKDVIIVFGGPHATVVSDECMRYFDFIDVISLGEAEKTIIPLMEALLRDGDLSLVPSIVYRHDGGIKKNRGIELLSNEELGEYTVFDYSPFKFSKEEIISLEGGRGCPFGCTFCSTSTFWGRKFRVKPVETLIKEINCFHSLYGNTKFSIYHDLFTADRQYLREFCMSVIDQKLPYQYGCSSRIDVLDKEIIDLMQRANLKSIFLGIETGSKRMQKEINKNLRLDKALELIKYMKDLGFEVTSSFIFCYPDETIEDFRETIKLIESMILLNVNKVLLLGFMPLPKTKETEKIKDRIYFDPSAIEKSIYNDNLFCDYSKELIQRYPEVFVQYYTFDSVVKDKYKYFNVMVNFITDTIRFFYYSFRYFIELYSLEGFYIKYEKEFEKMFNTDQHFSISQRTSKDILTVFTEIFKVFNEICVSEISISKDLFFSEIYRYEHAKLTYFLEGKTETEVHKFDINIDIAMERGVCHREKFYLKISRVEDEIITTKLSPLYGILKAIKESEIA